MTKYIWIGPRESDIAYTKDFFLSSITLYGNSNSGNYSFSSTQKSRINHNHITEEQTKFMNNMELELLNKYNDVKFMSYNPYLLGDCDLKVRENTICYNDPSVLEFFNSKINFRNMSKKICSTLNSKNIKGEHCSLKLFHQLFPDYDRFIVQADVASGGYGTLIIDNDSEDYVMSLIEKNNTYLVSPYYEKNIPINIHAIIYKNDILIFPASIQVMVEDKNRLLYRGADYITYATSVNGTLQSEFKEYTLKLCKEIQKAGYLGVLGIDAMIIDDEIYILEMNNRFQASTIAINKSLSELNLKTMPELNCEAFENEKSSVSQQDLDNLKIQYSCFTYIKEKNDIYKIHTDNLLNRLKSSKFVSDILMDGYSQFDCTIEDEAYLFRVVFNTNIVGISHEQKVHLHPNLLTPSESWYNDIKNKKDFIKTKISLLNQGAVLTDSAKRHLEENGGMQPGVYCSVDLIVDRKYAVNSPLYVKFAELSPFTIDYQKNKLSLFYYDLELYEITIDAEDENSQKVTSTGVPIKNICLKSLDRLRIQNCSFCVFKESNIPCKFCEAQYKTIDFNLDDIVEAIDIYFKNTVSFDHILVGGLSNKIGDEKDNILEICKHIRQHTDMNIYLMCLPPSNIQEVDEYVSSGVTEIGFNIEIFDREVAKELMPGKGMFKTEQYISALKKAVQLLGKNGAVRTAFVVGLESAESLLNGIEKMCQIGVAPILSVFRPIPGTAMENNIAPSNDFLYNVYVRASAICKKYNLSLGPSCGYCQNNTLSLKTIS